MVTLEKAAVLVREAKRVLELLLQYTVVLVFQT